eukprot:1236434-Pleurochrysis_carterae.AAC.1
MPVCTVRSLVQSCLNLALLYNLEALGTPTPACTPASVRASCGARCSGQSGLFRTSACDRVVVPGRPARVRGARAQAAARLARRAHNARRMVALAAACQTHDAHTHQ